MSEEKVEGAGSKGTETVDVDAEGRPVARDPDEVNAEGEARIPQERLDREVGRRKETEERLSAAESERETLKSRLEEVEDAAAAGIPLHPDYLTREERTLVVRANELEAEEVRLESAEEGIEDDPKLNTPAKVKARLTEVRHELRRIEGKANAAFERGKTQQLADLKAGREARVAREKAKATAERKKEERRPEESLAGTGAGGTREGESKKRGPSEDRFLKAGATREAAARELAELVPD
jgi:hypothetical protein